MSALSCSISAFAFLIDASFSSIVFLQKEAKDANATSLARQLARAHSFYLKPSLREDPTLT